MTNLANFVPSRTTTLVVITAMQIADLCFESMVKRRPLEQFLKAGDFSESGQLAGEVKRETIEVRKTN